MLEERELTPYIGPALFKAECHTAQVRWLGQFVSGPRQRSYARGEIIGFTETSPHCEHKTGDRFDCVARC